MPKLILMGDSGYSLDLDEEEARQLLALAGWTQGNELQAVFDALHAEFDGISGYDVRTPQGKRPPPICLRKIVPEAA